jgi:hypothetical protein
VRKKIQDYIQNKQASIEPRTLKIEVHMRLGRMIGTALPLNVLTVAVVEEVLPPGADPLPDETALLGSAEPPP